MEDLVQDLQYGFRQLFRSRGFSILAILCLTLGIGANAAVFSWIEGILFRPYPAVAHQDRLLAIGGTARGETADQILANRRVPWTIRRPSLRKPRAKEPPHGGGGGSGSDGSSSDAVSNE